MPRGTWQTTDDGGAAKAVAVLVIAVLITAALFSAAESAGRMLGDLLVIIPVAAGSLTVGAILVFIIMRLRRTRGRSAEPVRLWHANTQAIPPPPPRAVAPPAVINVNIGPEFAAGLLDAALATAITRNAIGGTNGHLQPEEPAEHHQ